MHVDKCIYSFQVYYYLLKVYLEPPEPSILGLQSFKDEWKPKPNLSEALRIMEEHAGCIDTVKVGHDNSSAVT